MMWFQLLVVATLATGSKPIVQRVELSRASLKQQIRLECPVGQTTRIIMPERLKSMVGGKGVGKAFGVAPVERAPRGIIAIRPPQMHPVPGQLEVEGPTIKLKFALQTVSQGIGSDIEIVLKDVAPEPAPQPPAATPEPTPPPAAPATPTPKTKPRAPKAAPAPAEPVEPKPPAVTSIQIEATPWADVELDGKPIGRTPQSVITDAGSHLLRFIHPEYLPYNRKVSVAEGETRDVHVDLPAEALPAPKEEPEAVAAMPAQPEPAPPPTPEPTPEPTPVAPVPAAPAPASAEAIDTVALALAKRVGIGREEGLPGEPMAVLEDALKGERLAWFRFRIRRAGDRDIERITLRYKGEESVVRTVLVDRSGRDLRLVVQVPREKTDGARITIKVVSGPTYHFALDAPNIRNFFKSLVF